MYFESTEISPLRIPDVAKILGGANVKQVKCGQDESGIVVTNCTFPLERLLPLESGSERSIIAEMAMFVDVMLDLPQEKGSSKCGT